MKSLKSWARNSSFILWVSVVSCAKGPVIHYSNSMGEDVIRSINVGRADLKTVRAETKIEYRKRGRIIRFHASLLAKEPRSLFVQSSGFGIPAVLVSIKDEDVKVYIPSKNRFYQGKSKDGLYSVLGSTLGTGEWMKILLGSTPEMGEVTDVNQTDEDWIILAKTKKQKMRYVVDQHSGWLKSYETLDGKTKVEFGDPLVTPEGGFPSTLNVETSGGVVKIQFEKVEANPTLQKDLFDIETPKTLIPETIPVEGSLIE